MLPRCNHGFAKSAGQRRVVARARVIPPRCANIPAAGVFIALLILLSVVPARAITPVQAERGHAISLRLKCMCGGCEDTVGTCNHSGGAFAGPCATAKSMLKEIDQRVARGESDDLILQDFVQEYGPTVLVSPPAKGFDWLVWAMPIILPLLAFVLVWQVVVRWRRHTATEPAAAAGPPVSAELLARARREAGGGADE